MPYFKSESSGIIKIPDDIKNFALPVGAIPVTDAEVRDLEKGLEYQPTWADLRRAAYPSWHEFADALYHSEKGDRTKLEEWVRNCETVKTKIPKPE